MEPVGRDRRAVEPRRGATRVRPAATTGRAATETGPGPSGAGARLRGVERRCTRASSPGFRSLRGLTTAITWVVGIEVLATLAVVGTVVNRLVKLDAFEDHPLALGSYSSYRDADDAVGTAAGWMLIIAVAIAVLCMIYLFRSSQNTELWATTSRTWAPGWTIGAWFIPLANFVLPVLVVREIWLRSALVVGGAGRVFGWWFTFVAGAVLLGLDTDPDSFDSARTEDYLNRRGRGAAHRRRAASRVDGARPDRAPGRTRLFVSRLTARR